MKSVRNGAAKGTCLRQFYALAVLLLAGGVSDTWAQCGEPGRPPCQPMYQQCGQPGERPCQPLPKVYPCPVPTDPTSCNTTTPSYNSSGSRITPGDVNRVTDRAADLWQSLNAESERKAAREEERNRRIDQQTQIGTQQLLNAAASDPSLNPWATSPKPEKSEESPPKLTNCDCAKIVGACQGSVRAMPTSSTKGSYGAELSIRASAPRCARVSYYVDSTPYFNVLSQGNSTTDSVWGQRPVTQDTITNVECHVCSSTGR